MTEFERTTVRQTVDEPVVPVVEPTPRPATPVERAYARSAPSTTGPR